MDSSLLTRRTHDEYWRPINGNASRSRPQSGLNSTFRSGRQAAYLALWQQRQSRVQSSRPLGTPRCFVVPSRPPSGLHPRPPSSGLTPHPPSHPPSTSSRPHPVIAPQPPSGPPPMRPDSRKPTLTRGRVPRRVLSSHFGGPTPSCEVVADPEKRVQIVSPPNFDAPDILIAPPVPWRHRCVDTPVMMAMENNEDEKESDVDDSDDDIVSDCGDESLCDTSSVTPTPPPTPPRLIPRPPAEPPDGSSVRSILKRARLREARLAPPTAYVPSPIHGPVPQETELTEILTIRPKPMVSHTPRESTGRIPTIRQSDRGVRFDMANNEVIEIARRRPHRPTIYPDSLQLI